MIKISYLSQPRAAGAKTGANVSFFFDHPDGTKSKPYQAVFDPIRGAYVSPDDYQKDSADATEKARLLKAQKVQATTTTSNRVLQPKGNKPTSNKAFSRLLASVKKISRRFNGNS